MSSAEETNADQVAFWNGQGGQTWVKRQYHTDTTLTPVNEALLAFAGARPGERVLDVGCGCGVVTLDLARAVGSGGRVTGLDISGPMLAEGAARASAAGIANIEWREADAASAELGDFDLLTSAFGVMFFGDPVAAFTHMRAAASPDARMALVCWRPLGENPWIEVPMSAVTPHLPPRSKGVPNSPGMFGFANPDHVTGVLTAAGWTAPKFEPLDVALDIAAGNGLDAAVEQSTQIGAVNSWLRGQSDEIVTASVASIRAALEPCVDGDHVRLPGAMWLISSTPA